jgi:hypothetical protein
MQAAARSGAAARPSANYTVGSEPYVEYVEKYLKGGAYQDNPKRQNPATHR